MPTHKGTSRSNMYAPNHTCQKCGWSGKDWGFKYHRYCTKCHNKWRRERAEERRAYALPKTNVEIADGIIVTEHVHNRLRRKARRKVGYTASYWLARIIPAVAVLGSMHQIDIVNESFGSDGAIFGIMFAGLFLAIAGYCIFELVWQGKITRVTTTLADARQREIQEQKRFYASPEWRLVREQVIEEQGRICQNCRRRIANDYDVTVDHIKPRSKFPELALEKSNLQVLCRKCNSAKGATYEETVVVSSETTEADYYSG